MPEVLIKGNRTPNHTKVVDIPLTASAAEINDLLFPLTGGNGDTVVGFTITRWDERPTMVGLSFGWEDN